MNCKNHIEAEAGFMCSTCGKPLCTECAVRLNNTVYCKECLEKMVNMMSSNNRAMPRNIRKSKFITFIFSCMPGAGHMYLGLINKGLYLMGLYFAGFVSILLISEVLHMYWFNSLIAPLSIMSIAYSVFDSLQILSLLNSGKIINDAESLNLNAELDIIKDKFFSKKNTIGYVLIALGCIGLFNMISDTIVSVLSRYFNFYLPFSISSLLIPILLVIAGIYLIRKGSSTKM